MGLRKLTTATAILIGLSTAACSEEDTSAEAPSANDGTLTLATLKDADYMAGKNAFQARCSACHTLADSSADIAGPGLWGVFDRVAGKKEGFAFSDSMAKSGIKWTPDTVLAFLSDPEGYIPDNSMMIPEPLPKQLSTDLISFMYVETGKADWEAPETNFAEAQIDKSLPPSERFPSFWNHMMNNTVHYRMVTADGDEYIFDAYFQPNGSVAGSDGSKGFWHLTENDFFCYAMHQIDFSTDEFVECFPVGAMAIPRFREELWVSNPAKGIKMHGGILPGRPDDQIMNQ